MEASNFVNVQVMKLQETEELFPLKEMKKTRQLSVTCGSKLRRC